MSVRPHERARFRTDSTMKPRTFRPRRDERHTLPETDER